MSLRVLNACLFLGWMLASAGIAMWNLPAGIAAGGFLLLALTLLLARMGGVYGSRGND